MVVDRRGLWFDSYISSPWHDKLISLILMIVSLDSVNCFPWCWGHLSPDVIMLTTKVSSFWHEVFVFFYRVTDSYRFCCLTPDTVDCLPKPDEFSSCEDLMSNYVLRVSIWVLGIIALCGNFLVIVWRVRDFRGGKVRRTMKISKKDCMKIRCRLCVCDFKISDTQISNV